MATAEQAQNALDQVKDSGSGRSAIEMGWIDQVRVIPPRAVIRLTLPGFAQSQRDRLAQEARQVLLELNGISEVQIELGEAASQGPIGQAGHGQSAEPQAIQGVRQVIAVSSGKGGVGKSTVAVNLACALAQEGLSVGLLDADIYGPNTPTMLGVADRTPEVSGNGAEQCIIPIESHGVAMVSMGLLIEENQPVIWRGPMLNGIIRQFLYQAYWGGAGCFGSRSTSRHWRCTVVTSAGSSHCGGGNCHHPPESFTAGCTPRTGNVQANGRQCARRGRKHDRLRTPRSTRTSLRPIRLWRGRTAGARK